LTPSVLVARTSPIPRWKPQWRRSRCPLASAATTFFSWWRADATTIRDLIDLPTDTEQEGGAPYPEIPETVCTGHDRSYSYSYDIPVVYGHHWRQWAPDEHDDWTQRTVCVDFSAVRGGPLVAYRWRGEVEIDRSHYEWYRTEADHGENLPTG